MRLKFFCSALLTLFAASTMTADDCIFCKIATRESSSTYIEFESDSIVIFRDIHPASDLHYLAIPKVHLKNAKSLTAEHIPLLEEMKAELNELMLKKSSELIRSEISLGFHWPPFNSIGHLHMHAIAPVSKMRFLQRQMFKKNTFWYREADKVIDSLKSTGTPT